MPQKDWCLMVMFSASTAAAATDSVVRDVFERPVALANEARAESNIPNGHVGLIVNYRVFKARESGQGRKARGHGEAVLDLSALARVPARELPLLIQKLQELQSSLDDGIEAAERM